jgi:hypothetical protein
MVKSGERLLTGLHMTTIPTEYLILALHCREDGKGRILDFRIRLERVASVARSNNTYS